MTDINVERLHEIDDDGEIGSPVNTWYCDGHVDHDDFLRAVLDDILDGDDVVPRVDRTWIRHAYLQRRPYFGGSWSADFVDEIPERSRAADWTAITVLGCETRRGGPACCIHGCRKPAMSGVPTRAVVDLTSSSATAYLYLCRDHTREFPGPSYRVFMVPVGATIQLPAPAGEPA